MTLSTNSISLIWLPSDDNQLFSTAKPDLSDPSIFLMGDGGDSRMQLRIMKYPWLILVFVQQYLRTEQQGIVM